jgi:hypothetical protein
LFTFAHVAVLLDRLNRYEAAATVDRFIGDRAPREPSTPICLPQSNT